MYKTLFIHKYTIIAHDFCAIHIRSISLKLNKALILNYWLHYEMTQPFFSGILPSDLSISCSIAWNMSVTDCNRDSQN